jgi:protein tyrosine phosphatase
LKNDRYINANYILGEEFGVKRDYIATQGPQLHTRLDFWVMVIFYIKYKVKEHKSPLIIMLTKEEEGGRVKCDRYWPGKKGNILHLSDNDDSLKIEHIEEEKEDDFLKIKIKIAEEEKDDLFVTLLQFKGYIIFKNRLERF